MTNTTMQSITRHGGPKDRGAADAYYDRPSEPHYYISDSYNSPKVEQADMSEDEIAQYNEGFGKCVGSLRSGWIEEELEHRYNIGMTNTTRPTVREIRTILASHNLTLPRTCFNDKHVNGGRIKLWGKTYDLAEMQYLEQFLTVLFPKLDVEVYEWKGCSGRRGAGSSTCIKWTNDV